MICLSSFDSVVVRVGSTSVSRRIAAVTVPAARSFGSRRVRAPDQRGRVQPGRMPALAGPFRDLLDKRAALASFALRVEGNENQAGSIPDGLPKLSSKANLSTIFETEFNLAAFRFR